MWGQQKNGRILTVVLIIATVVALGAVFIFYVLDPWSDFRDSREAKRWADVTSIVTAIKINQVDNGGLYITAVENAREGESYMITDGSFGVDCDDKNEYCNIKVSGGDNCLDLSSLVLAGYLDEVPVSPKGKMSWGSSRTGYVLRKDESGVLTVSACEPEKTDAVWAAR